MTTQIDPKSKQSAQRSMPKAESNQMPGQILLVVPARYQSTRLPAKLVQQLGHQTVIEHVCDRLLELEERLKRENCLNSFEIKAGVATDHAEIQALVLGKGLKCLRSQQNHDNGTSRVREFVRNELNWIETVENDNVSARTVSFETRLKNTFVLNLQGDEPFISVEDVLRLLLQFTESNVNLFPMGTLIHRNSSFSDFLDPSTVKVVTGAGQRGLYFSRAPIPWPRAILGTDSLENCIMKVPEEIPENWFFWQHLGIYVYRASYLLEYDRARGAEFETGAKTSDDHFCFFARESKQFRESEGCADGIDVIEGLEQLAVLQEGRNIWVTEAFVASKGIDTQRDLERARASYSQKSV